MMSARRWLLASGLLLSACGGGNTPDAAAPSPDVPAADAGDDLAPEAAPVDVPRDTPDAPADVRNPMFGECASRAQCQGMNPTCVTVLDGYPRGLCTRTCVDDADCGDTGICWTVGSNRVCLPTCRTVADCRDGYQCQGITGRTERACFPWCSDAAQCAPRMCNAWTRRCAATIDTVRADNGAPCIAGNDCRSLRCTTELNADGTPSGNLDGICSSLCTIAEDADYEGERLPQSNCPPRSVCARDTSSVAGGIGFCRVECAESSDCRPGYICSRPARPGADAGTYANGYCAPMNCHFGTQRCPAGATCRTTRMNDAGMPTSGLCERPSDGGDATSDAVVDAVVDGAATDLGAADAGADGG
jgi:hypothetical protein